jgi:hypothetical protein
VPKLAEEVEIFSSLPDEAVVRTPVTEAVTGLSGRTIRYHPDLPRVQLSEGRYGQRVRDIRKLLREGYRR